jgi:hypothetical protein
MKRPPNLNTLFVGWNNIYYPERGKPVTMVGFKLFKPDIDELKNKKDTLSLINLLEDKDPDTRTNAIQAILLSHS